MSALALKLIACVSMLLDHIGYCIPSLLPLRVVGRIAFPLYVFLLTEGFRRTSSRPRYALRLLIFAVIAQPAFGLMVKNDVWYSGGSVMVTLLISFLCLWAVEFCRNRPLLRPLSWLLVLGVCILYHLEILRSDYGAHGVLLTFVFYYLGTPKEAESRRQAILRMLALMFCALAASYYEYLIKNGTELLGYVFSQPYKFETLTPWKRVQAFSLLAIPLTVFYNGKKGWAPASLPARKAMQYGFYLYYPTHMLLLYLTIR